MTRTQLYEDLTFWYGMDTAFTPCEFRGSSFAKVSGLCELAFDFCENEEKWGSWSPAIQSDPIVHRCMNRATLVVKPKAIPASSFWWPNYLFAPRTKAIQAMIRDTESRIALFERTVR